MTATDSVIPFVFADLPVRGALVQLDDAWRRMQAGRDYDGASLTLLGEATAAAALIAQSLKFDGTVTLQLSLNGPLLMVQCSDRLDIRGTVTAGELGTELRFADLARGATCAVTVDAGAMERPYQGIVEVQADSLAASLENYFGRSVQLPSHLALVAGPERCGGILLQQLPQGAEPDGDDWRRLGLLARTLRDADLAGGATTGLLAQVFGEDDLRAFERRAVRFRCRCSRGRVEDVVRLLGAREAHAALAATGFIDIRCEYCGQSRRLDRVDVAQIFAGAPAPDKSTLH